MSYNKVQCAIYDKGYIITRDNRLGLRKIARTTVRYLFAMIKRTPTTMILLIFPGSRWITRKTLRSTTSSNKELSQITKKSVVNEVTRHENQHPNQTPKSLVSLSATKPINDTPRETSRRIYGIATRFETKITGKLIYVYVCLWMNRYGSAKYINLINFQYIKFNFFFCQQFTFLFFF